MTKIVQFFKEVQVELSKVIWPSRQQMVVYTLVVIGFSLAIAFLLGALDFGFQQILTRYLIK